MQSLKKVLEKNPQLTCSANPVKAQISSLKTNQEHPATSANSDMPKWDKRIDTLFARLGAIYGRLWVGLYQSDVFLNLAKQEWSEGLKSFDNQILKEALLNFRNASDYPPTLPQFIEEGKSMMRRREPTGPRFGDIKLANPETAKRHLKIMMEMLGRKSKNY